MAAGQIYGHEPETLNSRDPDKNELQLVRQHTEVPPAKRINTTGNNQIGEGNTQIITGSTTYNTITNNYHFHIENYYQHGNDPFSLDKSFQLKSDDQLLALTNRTGTQILCSREGILPDSCHYPSNLNGIECPKCGNYISADSTRTRDAEAALGRELSRPNGSTSRQMDEAEYNFIEFYDQRRRWRNGRRWVVQENKDGSRIITSKSWFGSFFRSLANNAWPLQE